MKRIASKGALYVDYDIDWRLWELNIGVSFARPYDTTLETGVNVALGPVHVEVGFAQETFKGV